MLRLWIRTFGKEFYKQHAGLLLIIFYALFGWMKSGDITGYLHAVLVAICSTPIAIAVWCLFIFLYGIKALVFVLHKLSTPVYSFVQNSCAAKKKDQLTSWMGLYLTLLFPPLFITLSIVVTAIVYHYYMNALIMSIVIILIVWSLIKATFRKINYGFRPSANFLRLKISLKKPRWTWSFHYVLKKQALMLIICKILSFVFFTGITWMFADSGDDIRIYLIAVLAAIIAHSTLIAAVWNFEKSLLSFQNSLPVNLWKRLFHTLLFLFILFSPELILYISKAPYSILSLTGILLFSMSALLTLKTALDIVGDNMEQYLKFIFIFFLTVIFAILSRQFLPLSLLLIVLSISYHRYRFYKSML
jgi:hypothetical protein